jgi:hypothetical protein
MSENNYSFVNWVGFDLVFISKDIRK